MKTLNKILILALILLTFSCEDIFEDDISNDVIQLISPTNGSLISSNVTTFQWDALIGADKYRVQVFNASQVIVLDSLVVNKTSLTAPLGQGNYQCRVRGENFAYQSAYSLPVSFSVLESLDLTTQQVVLDSPSSGFRTNAASIICSWQDLKPADFYNLELIDVSNGQTIVYQQSNILTNSVTISNTQIAKDAEYQWKIKAINSTSETPFSVRNFFIDRVNPNQPQNSLPANNSLQVANQSVALSWTIPADTGAIQSTISYTIEFSNSITFATLIQTSNSVTNTLQITFTAPGEYYWRVKANDSAGNSGIYSTPFKFTIN